MRTMLAAALRPRKPQSTGDTAATTNGAGIRDEPRGAKATASKGEFARPDGRSRVRSARGGPVSLLCHEGSQDLFLFAGGYLEVVKSPAKLNKDHLVEDLGCDDLRILQKVVAEMVDDRRDGVDATKALIQALLWHLLRPPFLRLELPVARGARSLQRGYAGRLGKGGDDEEVCTSLNRRELQGMPSTDRAGEGWPPLPY